MKIGRGQGHTGKGQEIPNGHIGGDWEHEAAQIEAGARQLEGRQRDRRQSSKEAARLQLHTGDGCQHILTWIQSHASQVDLKRIAQLDDKIRNRQRHLAAVAKIKAS